MLRQSKKVYINNGTTVNPSWTDRITYCWVPTSSYPLPSSIAWDTITYTASAGTYGSDIMPGDYTLLPVALCTDYFELYTPAGAFDDTNSQQLLGFYAHQAGDYRCIYSKAKAETFVSTFYEGREGKLGIGASAHKVPFYQLVAETGIDVTMNDAALSVYAGSGYVTYAKNVILTEAASTETIALNEEMEVVFNTTNIPALLNAEMRVYVKEIGAYFIGGSRSTETCVWTYYDDLHVDGFIRKSDVVKVRKVSIPTKVVSGVTIPAEHSIVLCLKDGSEFEICMGEVDNQTTWTNDYVGLAAAETDIQTWLV